MKDSKLRKSNIELLRIVAILMIISFHYVYHSGYCNPSLTINSFLIKSFYYYGESGVNLFLLISGYFMIHSKFKIKKLVLLFGELFFYVFVTSAAAYYIEPTTFASFNQMLLKPIIQTINPQYWFFTVYVLIYIFSPYINRMLLNLSKREFQRLILISTVIYSVIPTVFGIKYNNPELMYFYSRLIWSLIIYTIGAYIRVFGIPRLQSKKASSAGAGITLAFMLLSIAAIGKLKDFHLLTDLDVTYFWHPNTVPILIFSVCVFCFFNEWEIKSNRVINKAASTVFGIYLLHDSIYRDIFWKNIFHSNEQLNGKMPVLSIILSTIAVFVLGATIDLFRQLTEKGIVAVVERINIRKYLIYVFKRVRQNP